MTYFLYNNSWNGNRLLVYLQKNMFEHVFWNILKKEFENRDSSAARHLVRRGLQLNDGKALHIRPKKHKKLSLNLICRMTWAEALQRLNAVLKGVYSKKVYISNLLNSESLFYYSAFKTKISKIWTKIEIILLL